MSESCRFVGSYALATAAINIFEANGHRRSDSIAVNSYSAPRVLVPSCELSLTMQSYPPFEVRTVLRTTY